MPSVTVSRTPVSDAPCASGDCRACGCKQTCLFLSEYAVTLLASGATCIRLEKNLTRMARAFGKRVETTIMPRHIHMTVWDPACGDTFTSIATVRTAPISFSLNSRLSRLSWNVADHNLTLPQTRRMFEMIVRQENDNPVRTLLLASLANASFCGIFGGDAMAMAVVFAATAIGISLKNLLLHLKTDGRIVFFLCALLSTVAAASAYLLPECATPAVAVGTSVLYLVPGIPFINSFSDMLYKHYICAFSRFTDAVVLTASLSLGLCLGMWLTKVNLF